MLTPVKRSDFSLFDSLSNWNNSLWKGFEDMFGANGSLLVSDSYEENGKLHYLFDLPGVQKENLSVIQDGSSIKVEASRKTRNGQSNYYTQFTVPQELVAETLQASLEDGVLTVSFELPKPQVETPNEPKKIEVKSKSSSSKKQLA